MGPVEPEAARTVMPVVPRSVSAEAEELRQVAVLLVRHGARAEVPAQPELSVREATAAVTLVSISDLAAAAAADTTAAAAAEATAGEHHLLAVAAAAADPALLPLAELAPVQPIPAPEL